ncbi:hypothetical protein HN031_18005 [Nocardioides sp. zg-1308]|uniref:Tetracycline repressor TetR C-terminal domain-containing protein n=1 Tax=Nocardioides renjunii TaxID=3095075 RepID=A0ABU5K9Z8_9ACTN|nr:MULTISPECIES: hypothetical protein [unclassified Nocardioides]MDZ5661726.1 hypothetical protein [Nocardioides sp. S-58]NPD06572.1 hypothetical protein [Nocardioides sp. zg-1308]WQQ23969.1 hypothetical protein SHK17_08255 [Nocardioides sp. S-34]
MLSDDLTTAPAPDVLAALEECRSAELEREGIAMYVAVADARPGRPAPATDSAPDPAATRLAELFDHYHDALAAAGFPRSAHEPPDAPDLTGGGRELIDVLVVLSDRHLHARPEQPSHEGRQS